jgi:hypothetical protein
VIPPATFRHVELAERDTHAPVGGIIFEELLIQPNGGGRIPEPGTCDFPGTQPKLTQISGVDTALDTLLEQSQRLLVFSPCGADLRQLPERPQTALILSQELTH